VARSQSGTRGFWQRLARARRIAVVAPATLAATAAVILALFALQISGHRQPQTADAARIGRAFARTVPSITSWRWTLHARRGSTEDSAQFQAVLNPSQALRIYYGRPYLYDGGHWTAIEWNMARMGGGIARPADWEWAFAILPSLLRDHITHLPGAVMDGHTVERFADLDRLGGKRSVAVTAWVDPSSGLVLRLERVVQIGSRMLESDRVDYRYGARSS
jgi:hypothetical protein